MAFIPINIPPGIDKETPSLTSSPAWRDCDKVRFKSGQPEKIGGYQQTQAGGFENFKGVARSMIAWRTNAGLTVTAIGTHKKLYLYIDNYIDITPLRSWIIVPSCLDFDATGGGNTVTVNHTNHGLDPTAERLTVRVDGAIITGGFADLELAHSEINRSHAVTYVDANTYTFEVATGANGTLTGQGGADLKLHYDFEIITTLTDALSISNGVAPFENVTVTVTHVDHGVSTGDFATIVGVPDPINTVPPLPVDTYIEEEINANHELTRIDKDTYTFQITTPVTATTTIWGTITVEYEVPVGNQHEVQNVGYGAGAWGFGTWGTPRALATEVQDLRHWSLDAYGEDLVCCPNNGRIYRLDVSNIFTPNQRASLVGNSPAFNDAVVVTNPDRHLVALASEESGIHDKMLVRWSDQETIDDWIPVAENTAGSQILSGASRIFKAERSQSSTLIWTDGGLYSMEFQGPPFTFGFNELGRNCGSVSYEAIATHNSVSYWMSDEDFFIYDGVVRTIPCSVHRYVFDNLNQNQKSKVYAGLNKNFHEVIWFYPVGTGSTEITNYVIFNFRENLWYVGTFDRTAWLDSELHQYPLATDSTGLIYHHEFRDDADGTPLTAFIESAEFDIGEGDKLLLASRIVPDMGFEFGNVEYTLKYRRYPHAGLLSETTQTVDANTTKLDVRMRARQIALRISSDELRDRWYMGIPRLDVRPDGRR